MTDDEFEAMADGPDARLRSVQVLLDWVHGKAVDAGNSEVAGWLTEIDQLVEAARQRLPVA